MFRENRLLKSRNFKLAQHCIMRVTVCTNVELKVFSCKRSECDPAQGVAVHNKMYPYVHVCCPQCGLAVPPVSTTFHLKARRTCCSQSSYNEHRRFPVTCMPVWLTCKSIPPLSPVLYRCCKCSFHIPVFVVRRFKTKHVFKAVISVVRDRVIGWQYHKNT